MAEPEWAKILAYLHENNGKFVIDLSDREMNGREELENAVYDELKEVIDWDNPQYDAIKNAQTHLQSVGVVELQPSLDSPAIALTEKGFDVAHERELNKRHDSTNRVLSALSAGLLFAAAVQAFGAYYSVPESERILMAAGTALVGALIIIVIIAIYHHE